MRLLLLPLLLLAACSREASTTSDPAAPEPSAAASAAEAAQAAALIKGDTRSFRSWEAVCDNTRSCTLFGFPSEEDVVEASGFVRIERAAGPDAAPTVTLAVGPAGGGEMTGAVSLTVAVDGGAPVRATASGEGGPYRLARLEGEPARALVAAIRNGRTLTLTAEGAPGVAVSLDGAAASLLWADEVQGRVGTVTALARPGDRPASAVPAAPAPPVVRVVKPLGGAVTPSPALLRAKPVTDCLAEQVDSSSAEVTGTRLTAELVLWEIPCGAGAYNQATAFFYGDAAGGGLRPVPLSEPEQQGEGYLAPNQAINAALNPETGRIGAFSKARGIGDCGSQDEWAWDGRAFVHTGQLIMGRCAGVIWDDWAVLNRTTAG